MKKILEAIALALAGYIVYELVSRYLGEKEAAQQQAAAPAARATSRPAPANLGTVRGAAMTGGGGGAESHTAGTDGSNLSERVGRGVVRRGRGTPLDPNA